MCFLLLRKHTDFRQTRDGLNDETLTDGVWMGGHFRVSPWQQPPTPKKVVHPRAVFFSHGCLNLGELDGDSNLPSFLWLPIDFTISPDFERFFDRFSDGFERDELDLDIQVS